MQVQYVGPDRAMRGRTAILRRGPQALIQADFPPDTQFDAKGRPVWSPDMGDTLSPSPAAFALAHPECFGWHEVNASDWRDVHELPSAVAAL